MRKTITLDVSGRKCPVPLMKAKSALKTMASGDQLELISTDHQTYDDIVKFGSRGLFRLVQFSKADNRYVFLLEKC